MGSHDEKRQILKYIEDRNSYSASQTETVQVENQDIFQEILELTTEYKFLAIDTEHEPTSQKKVDKSTVEQRNLRVRGFDETLKEGVVKNELVQKFKEIGKLDGNPKYMDTRHGKPPAATLAYGKPESALEAIEKFNGKEMMEIGAKSLQVELKKAPSKSLEAVKQYVALLQISFPNGKCFLLNHRLNLPKEFLDMLENPEILKIGIGLPGDDLRRMKLQWNIEPKGLVDIRHVVREFKPQAVANKSGAAHLAKEILGMELDPKDWKFHENWESETLDENQIEYAANDVLTAMAIVLKVINERDSTPQDANIDDVIKSTYDACLKFVDKVFKEAKSVGDKPKSGKTKEKPASTPKLIELLKSQFPEEPELNAKVGKIMGTLKKSKDVKIEDLEKVLADGKEDNIELVKAKIQEVQKMQDDKNVKSEIMTDHAASADV